MPYLPHVAARLFGVPLLVHEPKLTAILAGLGERFGLQPMAFDQEDEFAQRSSAQVRRPYAVTANGIAIVPVVGVLVNRSGQIDASSDPLRSYSQIERDVRMAVSDPAVRGIVYDHDTPGGECAGCFELAETIRGLRGQKPMVAVANGYSFSAGYALASAAEMVIVSQAGGVGSIGVVATHVNQAKRDAQQGLAWEYLFAGAKKVDGNSHEPLSDSARSDLTAEVQRCYGLFTGLVAANRGIPEADVRATEAGVFYGDGAVAARLADRTGTLVDAVAECARLADARKPAGAPAAARGRSSAQSTIGKGSAMSDRTDTAAGDTAPGTTEGTEEQRIAAAATSARTAAAEEAVAIVELCTMAGRPQDAAGHIKAGRSRGDVALALLQAKAGASGDATTTTAHEVQGGREAEAPADVDKAWEGSISRVCGAVREGV